MTVLPRLPDHTVLIDSFSCYALGVTTDPTFQEWNYEEVAIENGPSKFYRTNLKLRKVNFNATLKGDRQQVRQVLGKLINKRVRFSSIYIGAFDAIVKIRADPMENFPDVTQARFEVQEVKDVYL